MASGRVVKERLLNGSKRWQCSGGLWLLPPKRTAHLVVRHLVWRRWLLQEMAQYSAPIALYIPTQISQGNLAQSPALANVLSSKRDMLSMHTTHTHAHIYTYTHIRTHTTSGNIIFPDSSNSVIHWDERYNGSLWNATYHLVVSLLWPGEEKVCVHYIIPFND